MRSELGTSGRQRDSAGGRDRRHAVRHHRGGDGASPASGPPAKGDADPILSAGPESPVSRRRLKPLKPIVPCPPAVVHEEPPLRHLLGSGTLLQRDLPVSIRTAVERRGRHQTGGGPRRPASDARGGSVARRAPPGHDQSASARATRKPGPNIRLQFDLSRDIDAATQDVQRTHRRATESAAAESMSEALRAEATCDCNPPSRRRERTSGDRGGVSLNLGSCGIRCVLSEPGSHFSRCKPSRATLHESPWRF